MTVQERIYDTYKNVIDTKENFHQHICATYDNFGIKHTYGMARIENSSDFRLVIRYVIPGLGSYMVLEDHYIFKFHAYNDADNPEYSFIVPVISGYYI